MIIEQENTELDQSAEYAKSLQAILARPLSLETIDTYADRALEEVISLSEKVTRRYKMNNPDTAGIPADTLEDQAFRSYNLQDIGQILDYLAQKSNEIDTLDSIIEKAEPVDSPLLPPDLSAALSVMGDGENEKGSELLQPRVKTLLFILSNRFGVDIHDNEQLRLRKGVNFDDMRRKESYYSIEVPSLERTILVCDEVGNVTFVMDSALLESYDISNDDLIGLTKKQLKELIEDDSELGSVMVNTSQFVARLIALINDPKTKESKKELLVEDSTEQLLVPPVPEGYLSAAGMATEWQRDSDRVRKVISNLQNELGPIGTYRFNLKQSLGYSPEQQEMIKLTLDEHFPAIEMIPEDYRSVKSLAKEWDISDYVIYRNLKEVEGALGEVKSYRIGTAPGLGYSPEQQAIIHEMLAAKHVFEKNAPDGIETEVSMRRMWGFHTGMIHAAIVDLGEQLGEVRKYKFNTTVAPGYTPEQVVMIEQYLRAKGSFNEKASDEYKSVSNMADSWGVSDNVIQKVLSELGDEIGEVPQLLFGKGNNLASAFNERQQNLIHEVLEARHLFSPPAPDGYLSFSKFALSIKGVSANVVKEAITLLESQLGEVKVYRFTTRFIKGYSPEQQKIIRDYILSRK